MTLNIMNVDYHPAILKYSKEQLLNALDQAYAYSDTDIIIQAVWQLKKRFNIIIKLGRYNYEIKTS